jgi:molybdopterin molybdotransferase
VLSVNEALQRSLATVRLTSSETIALAEAHGRILSETVESPSPLPPWDNSAMDGFAIRAVDTSDVSAPDPDVDACAETPTEHSNSVSLSVVGTIAAGQVAGVSLGTGEAMRIMTGAPMPDGADAVVMREHTTEHNGRIQVFRQIFPGQNVRSRGENVAPGDVVAAPGQILNAARIGLCAAVGRDKVSVAVAPKVGIVSTGDEIVLPGNALGPGQIYSSNGAALASLVREAGGHPVDCGIARDELDSTTAAFQRAMDCDLIVSSGGVSVGDFDIVKEAMATFGTEMDFWKVRMKPGKPLALGRIGGIPVFGLPGNPVSAQVGFLQFVRPWILTALGSSQPFLPVVRATMAFELHKKAGRAEFARVRVEWTQRGCEVHSTGDQGSGNQRSMSDANALLMLSEEAQRKEPGDTVSVQLLGGGFEGNTVPGYPW